MHAEPLRNPHTPLSSTEKVGWIAAICREALAAGNLSQALDLAARGLVETVGYFSCSIGVLDLDRRAVVNRAWCSRGSAKIPEGYRQTLDEGVVARVVRSGEATLGARNVATASAGWFSVTGTPASWVHW